MNIKIGDYVSFINYANEYGAHFVSVPQGEVVTAKVVELNPYDDAFFDAVEVQHVNHRYTQTVRVIDLIQKEEAA